MATYFGRELIQQMNNLRVPSGCLAIWGMGQMGVALKGDDSGILYIDLCLTDVVADRFDPAHFQRAFPAPVDPARHHQCRLRPVFPRASRSYRSADARTDCGGFAGCPIRHQRLGAKYTGRG